MDSRLAVVIVIFCCAACFILGMIFEAKNRPFEAKTQDTPVYVKRAWMIRPDGGWDYYENDRLRFGVDTDGDFYIDSDNAQAEEANTHNPKQANDPPSISYVQPGNGEGKVPEW